MKEVKNNAEVSIVSKPIEVNNSLVTTSEGMITNNQMAAIFDSDLFEGEGQDMNTTYLKKEDWLGVKGQEIKIAFGGTFTQGVDEETGREYDAVLFVSNFADGKTPVNYKTAVAKLVGAFKDGGKGLYKIVCTGEKKREGKKGTFVDFQVYLQKKIV